VSEEIIFTKEQVEKTYSNVCDDSWAKIVTLFGIKEDPNKVSIIRAIESDIKNCRYS
jgi:hypothetical protein